MTDSKKPRMGFEMTFQKKQAAEGEQEKKQPVPTDRSSFHIAVLGDFSGRENKGMSEPATISKRRLIEVDRDNLDEVLAKFDLELQLPLADNSADVIAIPIKSFDDFHPDQIYENVAVFSHLRSLRKRLQNNNSFAQAAEEVQGWLPRENTQTATTTATTPAPAATKISLDNLLDTVVSASRDVSQDIDSNSGASMVDRMIRQIVAPYVLPAADPRQDEMIAAVDQAIAAQMRFILHHPQFQALEAAWLSLDFLVSRVETGPKQKIFILDVSKAELDADLSRDDIAVSGMYKHFCDHSPGNTRFGVLLGNYRFAAQIEDVLLLLQLGEIAMQAGAPFIAAADEQFVGCESFAKTTDPDDWQFALRDGVNKAWTMLRESTVAERLALTVPRFLLRAPYGKKSKPIDAFKFEEMPAKHCHACYLWGNGAFVKAEQLARTFTTKTKAIDTDKFPVHQYDDEGELVTKPCAEISLTEKGGQKMLQQGLIPLWSVKNSDRILCRDYCSIALTGKSIL